MARLVSYKVKDESTYSTFSNKNLWNEEEKIDEFNENDSVCGKSCFCCDCFKRCCKWSSKETVSDDIEFAMVKYAKVLIPLNHEILIF